MRVLQALLSEAIDYARPSACEGAATLLRLYPSDFRRRYGRDVVDCARAAASDSGNRRSLMVIMDGLTTLCFAHRSADKSKGADIRVHQCGRVLSQCTGAFDSLR